MFLVDLFVVVGLDGVPPDPVKKSPIFLSSRFIFFVFVFLFLFFFSVRRTKKKKKKKKSPLFGKTISSQKTQSLMSQFCFRFHKKDTTKTQVSWISKQNNKKRKEQDIGPSSFGGTTHNLSCFPLLLLGWTNLGWRVNQHLKFVQQVCNKTTANHQIRKDLKKNQKEKKKKQKESNFFLIHYWDNIF